MSYNSLIWAIALVLVVGIVALAFIVVALTRPAPWVSPDLATRPGGTSAANAAPSSPRFSQEDLSQIAAIAAAMADRTGLQAPQAPQAPQALRPAAQPTGTKVPPAAAAQAPSGPAAAAQSAAAPVPALMRGSSELERVLTDVTMAERMMSIIRQLPGVDDFGSETGGRFIVAFIDPTCPYCHKAFAQLSGKLPVRWVVAPILPDRAGDVPNIARARGIVSAPDSLAALRRSFGGDKVQADADPVLDQALQQNAASWLQIANLLVHNGVSEREMGVPTFLIPQQDGRLAFYVGYDDNLLARLAAIYRKAA